MFANLNFDPTEERFEAAPNGFARRRGGAARSARVRRHELRRAWRPLTPSSARARRPARRAAEPKRCVSGRSGPRSSSSVTSTAKLRASAAYRPLVHAGWVQPGLPEADAEPFDLKVLGLLNPRGTVRVHLSRFLHITLDLTYQADGTSGPGVDSRRWARRARARAALPLGRASATRAATSCITSTIRRSECSCA